MSANVSIVTDTAKAVMTRTVVDFGAGAFAHINGDYAQHSQVKVYTTAYIDSTGGTVAVNSLRMLLTNTAQVDIAIVLPVNSTGTSAVTNAPPIITKQPGDQTVLVNTLAQFEVAAISDTPLVYQWQKNDANINGAVFANFVIPNTQFSDIARYRAVVSNANGSVISSEGTLTVGSQATVGGNNDINPLFDPLPQFLGFF